MELLKRWLQFLGVLFIIQLAVAETTAFAWGVLIACVIMIFGTLMVKLR